MSVYIGLCEQYDDGMRMAESPVITVRFRDKAGKRIEKRERWEPHVYLNPKNICIKQEFDFDAWKWFDLRKPRRITTGELEEHFRKMKSKDGQQVVRRVERDCDMRDVHGNYLWRIVLGSASHIWMLKRKFTPVFQATIRAEEQFCAYNDLSEYFEQVTDEPRILMFDLEEVLYRPAKGESLPFLCDNPDNELDRREINLIAVHETWTGEKHQWVYHPSFENRVEPVGHGYEGTREYFDSERAMLVSFLDYFKEVDPDILTAWASGFHDLPVLYWRCKSLGVPVNDFSPFGIWDAPMRGHNDYRWDSQPIRGINIIDMKEAFARYWHSAHSEKLASNSLKEVASNPRVGINETNFWDPDNFWDPNYHEFIDKYCEYNLKDVHLMAKLEERFGVIALQTRLQALLQGPWGSCFYGSRMGQVLLNRECKFRMPDDDLSLDVGDDDKKSFGGGEIGNPVAELTAGVHRNVAVLDIASMYPSIIIMKNVSHDTLDQYGDIEGHDCRFTSKFEGTLPRIVRTMMSERMYYKSEARKAKDRGDEAAEAKNDNSQAAVKVVMNTFYGLTGTTGKGKAAKAKGRRQRYAWADERLAATITMYGRQIVKLLREKCSEWGYESLYCHTDSVMVKMDDNKSIEECVAEGKELCSRLTAFLQEHYDTKDMVLEFETFFDRFLLAKTNGYAGRTAWDAKYETETLTGFDVQKLSFENRLKAKGFDVRKVNTAKVGRNIQRDVLEMMFDGASKEDILAFVGEQYQRVKNGEVTIEDVQTRGKVRKHFPHSPNCSCNSCPHIPGPKERPGWDYNENREAYKPGKPDSRPMMQYHRGMPIWRILPAERGAAAWHNDFLADGKHVPIERDDNFWWTYVSKAPVTVKSVDAHLPLRNGMGKRRRYTGIIAYRHPEQVNEGYELDYEALAERLVIDAVHIILEGAVFNYNPTLRARCAEIHVPPREEDDNGWKLAISKRRGIISRDVDALLAGPRGIIQKRNMRDFLL